jgi:predicted alpha/beta superfamily hydrolase
MKQILFLLALVFTVFSLPAGAQEFPTGGMHGLSTVHRYEIPSEALGTTYQILVRLPEAPSEPQANAEGARKPLPVVYLTDGGVTFPALGAYYRYLRYAEDVPDLILVGISYGTADWNNGNERSRDFTAPVAEREHWGGIEPFLDFLAAEVIPLIEEHYPADPQRRILFGQSLGGQAVLYTAQFRPGLFWGHIASNPALHRNLPLFLKPPKKPASGSAPRLFVSSADGDDPRFRGPALQWMGHWTVAEHPWELETRSLPGHNHFSTLPEAFRQGLKWLFSGD